MSERERNALGACIAIWLVVLILGAFGAYWVFYLQPKSERIDARLDEINAELDAIMRSDEYLDWFRSTHPEP